MKFKAPLLMILAFICLLGIIRADEPKPKIKNLSKEETEKVLKIAREGYEANQAYQQAVQAALIAPMEDCSKGIAALANMRITAARLDGIGSRRNDLLDAQRQKHDCDGCDWTPDGKSLVKPETPPNN